jgi:hypothetical protein
MMQIIIINPELQVFGYKIHEFEEKSGHFVLVNTVSHEGKLSNPQNAQENSVLFLILAAIYLAEGEIAEGDHNFYNYLFINH